MNKSIVLLICMLVFSVVLISGCVKPMYTEDPKLLEIANSILPPFNVTGNMTIRYGNVIQIEKNDWYKIDVYVRYLNEPWKDEWWGSLWFKENGQYGFNERGNK